MQSRQLTAALLAAVAFAAGVLVAGGNVLPGASAQSEGSAGGVICVLGTERTGDIPIVLVSVPDQVLLTYRYQYGNRQIELTSARSYRYDKQLVDFQTKGPTVEEVRQFVTQR